MGSGEVEFGWERVVQFPLLASVYHDGPHFVQYLTLLCGLDFSSLPESHN
jgi:hypothetical protein